MSENDVYDITVLGGGPTGLFAAFYSGLRNYKCKIIDSMPMLGGRLMAVYPDKYIYDVGGLPKILAKDLIHNLIEQISPYQIEICLGEHLQTMEQVSSRAELSSRGLTAGSSFMDPVVKPRGDNSLWKLTTDKNTHFSKTIVIAAGTGLYSPKKHSALNAEKFENTHLAYAVLDKQSYKDKNLVILGGGDSALDWANELVSISKNVTLVHRSNQLRAHGSSVEKLLQTSANVMLNHEALEFLGDEVLNGIKLQHVDTGEITHISCDSALVLFGFSNTLGKIQELGFEFKDNGILVNAKMETNLRGVFAAGDIARYEGKLDLIATGFSEAATAVAFAIHYINPKVKPQPLYSTTVMEIKEKKMKKH